MQLAHMHRAVYGPVRQALMLHQKGLNRQENHGGCKFSHTKDLPALQTGATVYYTTY